MPDPITPFPTASPSSSPRARAACSAFSLSAVFSAWRRLFANTSVVSWASISLNTVGISFGQIDPGSAPAASAIPCTLISIFFDPGQSTIDTGLGSTSSLPLSLPVDETFCPPNRRATSVSGRCVADSPIRWKPGAICSKRSSVILR